MRRLSAALVLALVAVVIWGRLSLPPYDDALFFSRFAWNAVNHGAFSWNPGEPPLHGNTSQLHQLLLAAHYLIAPSFGIQPVRWLGIATLLLGAIALGARFEAAPAALALGGWMAAAAAVSGMETAITMGLGAGFLALVWREEAPRLGVVTAGVLLLYLARPDTGLLTVGTLLVAPWPWRARLARLALAALGLTALLALFQWGYGRMFPLSVAVKAGGAVAEPMFLAKSHAAKLRHLGLFALCALPLLAWARPGPRARLLVPAAAFVAFQAFVTLDVMGLHARFFAPCLPWLATAAVLAPRRSVGAALLVVLGLFAVVGPGWEFLPRSSGWDIGRVPTFALWTIVAGGGALLLAPASWRLPGVLAAALGGQLVAPQAELALMNDAAYADGLMGQTRSWRQIRELGHCLGNDAHVVHSEVGVPGIVFAEGRITDLGGLMHPGIAAGTFSWESFCEAERPEIVYLPHPNYARLRAELEASPCLAAYVLLDDTGSSPVYVRADLSDRSRCHEGGLDVR